MTEYSNPRLEAAIENWPSGKHRVTAHFKVECVPGKGERGTRTTTGATKKLTYSDKVRIVDGDDGRTYFAEWSRGYRMVSIMKGDCKFQHESVGESDPRYADLCHLFD